MGTVKNGSVWLDVSKLGSKDASASSNGLAISTAAWTKAQLVLRNGLAGLVLSTILSKSLRPYSNPDDANDGRR